MEEAAAVRHTARASVDDVEPVRLRDDLLSFIGAGSMVPGALALFVAGASSANAPSANASSANAPSANAPSANAPSANAPSANVDADGQPATDHSHDGVDGVDDFDSVDGLAERAAGVQLIYDGLRLTRRLVHDEPWAHGGRDAADMHILAADVLVARGFYLLARTDAAAAAVDVVRSFGRDQTTHGADADENLERDVLELAAIVGTTSAGIDPSADLLSVVETLANDCTGGFPDADVLLGSATRDHLTQTVSSPVADH